MKDNIIRENEEFIFIDKALIKNKYNIVNDIFNYNMDDDEKWQLIVNLDIIFFHINFLLRNGHDEQYITNFLEAQGSVHNFRWICQDNGIQILGQ
jgi:hypothetical protein